MLDELICEDGGEARRRAAEAVGAGGVVAFRTDTFYGLGVNPFDATAVSRLNELKGREGKPILVIVSDAGEAARLSGGARPALFESLSRRLWPGPLTLVVPAAPSLPAELTAGTGTVGVRLPADEDVRAFVRACGGALTATSANRAGQPPARDAREVLAAFPAGLALVVDGGPARTDAPSTVVDVRGPSPRLIRAGVMPWEKILKAVTGDG